MHNLVLQSLHNCGRRPISLRALKAEFQACSTRVRLASSSAVSEETTRPKSALFISGKAATSQFKLLSPDVYPELLKQRKQILGKVLKLKKINLILDKLEEDLDLYSLLKDKLDALKKERNKLKTELKTQKLSESESGKLKSRLGDIKTKMDAFNTEVWRLEESAVLDFIKLPNCGELTVFEDEIVSIVEAGSQPKLGEDSLTYAQLISRDKLAEYSNNSHSALYLHSYLAKQELSISWKIQQRLMQENFEHFSNPDFVTSVGVEGVDGDPVDTNLFHLSPAQDFEDKASLNGMFLVGGASKYSFVSYFARHILLNGDILPMNLFSIGRQYKPVPEESTDILCTQQSTVVNCICLTQSRLQMEESLKKLVDLLTQILSEYGTVRIIKKSVEHLDISEETRFNFELFLPVSQKYVEVGHISVENDFYSRRMMFKQKAENSYRNMFTLTGNVMNITRTLAVILERDQFKSTTS